MSIFKRFASVLMILLLIISLSGCEKKTEVIKELSEYQNVNPPIENILRVKNGNIVDADGKKILLFGINLGNWMLMETWMNAIPEYTMDWGHYDTLELLKEKFGEKKTAELMRVYQENFITEKDIEQIEKLGFNCVRVPFWYRNFMHEDGTWLTESMNENPGFLRLDWLIEKCEEHGIYVILDMHGAPGGQSMNHSTGKAGRNLLYTDESCMQMAEKLWKEIAARYKDSSAVAAYDLLNEPQNNGGYDGENAWAAESEKAVMHTNAAYDRLYKAVRSVDEKHMISFEGIWSTSVLPDPKKHGYENMLYQLHLYDTEQGMIRYRVDELKKIRRKWDTAVLIGEFNNFEQERFATKKYARNDISYIKWTYKTLNTGSGWGIFNADTGHIDLNYASYEEILEFFETKLSTEHFTFNKTEMHFILP